MLSVFLVCSCLLADPIATQFDWPVKPKADYYVVDRGGCFDLSDYNGKYHLGEDWNGRGGGNTDLGDPIYCIANGRVVRVDNGTVESWGKVVVIAHTLPSLENVYSIYAHLQDIFVTKGQIVNLGVKIGTIGDYQGQAHLHFAIMKRGPFPPKATGYVKNLYLDIADDYYIPSLFISNRQNPTVLSLNSGGWKNFKVTDQTPISTAYVEVVNRLTGAAQYYSFFDALTNGTLKPVVRCTREGFVEEYGPSRMADFIFVPNGTKYGVRSTLASSLYKVNLVIFPIKIDEETMALRAKSDLLGSAYAYGPEFLESLPQTFSFSRIEWPEGVFNYHTQMSFVVYSLPSGLVAGWFAQPNLPLLERHLGIDVSFDQVIVLPHISPNKVD